MDSAIIEKYANAAGYSLEVAIADAVRFKEFLSKQPVEFNKETLRQALEISNLPTRQRTRKLKKREQELADYCLQELNMASNTVEGVSPGGVRKELIEHTYRTSLRIRDNAVNENHKLMVSLLQEVVAEQSLQSDSEDRKTEA